MARRFNDLNGRMIAALRAGTTIAQLMSDANKDEALRNYVKYITYQTPADHKRGATSRRELKGIENVNIEPFDLDVGEGNALMVTISKRALDYLNSNTAIKTAAQFKILAAGKLSFPTRGWYKPPKCIFRQKAANVINVSETSNKITGREYKTFFGPSQNGYVVPFGKTGTATEIQRREAMKAAVAGVLTAGYGISFQSEKVNLIPNKGVATSG